MFLLDCRLFCCFCFCTISAHENGVTLALSNFPRNDLFCKYVTFKLSEAKQIGALSKGNGGKGKGKREMKKKTKNHLMPNTQNGVKKKQKKKLEKMTLK